MDPRERSVLIVAERLLWRARRPPLPTETARAARRLGPGGMAATLDFERRLLAEAIDRGAGAAGLLGAEPVVAAPQCRSAAALAAADLARLLSELCELYGLEPAARNWRPLLNEGPMPVPAVSRWSLGPTARPAGSAGLERLLERLLGLPGFRPGQREALERALAGEDSLLVLPTGAGKSLVYQLAGLLLPGTCLVIEPTLSLIHDQKARLARAGITRVLALTGEPASLARRREDLSAVAAGEALFCFVAPERLQTDSFRAALRRLAGGAGLSLVAIDEAHCVTEWGHDFRPAYLTAGAAARRIAAAAGAPAPLVAVTGTLGEAALPELRQVLELGAGCLVAPLGLEAPRPELAFRVRRCRGKDKPRALAELLGRTLPASLGAAPLWRPRGRASSCGIVFCPHVEGPFGARAVAEGLRSRGWPVDVYHGKPPRGREREEWARERAAAAGRFLADRAPLLAATRAFGIGIDKPNIRYTVHYGLPSGEEAFAQESGRAGRDGRAAECWVLASVRDAERARRWLDPRTPAERVRSEVAGLGREEEDDVSRALALHVRAFPGPERELEDARQVLFRLGDWRRPGVRVLRMGGQHGPLVEKALYRLSTLGIVADYTVLWREQAHLVRLAGPDEPEISRRLRACVLGLGAPGAGAESGPAPEEALKALLDAVYATIERRRRASLGAMLERCLSVG